MEISPRHPFKYLAIVIAISLTSCAKNKNQTNNAPTEVTVITATPQKLTLTTELPGRVTPYRIAEIRPQVDGIIIKQLFNEGSTVQENDPLYQIDPARYKSLYHSAKGNLAHAEATFEIAKLKEKRYKDLVKIHAISQQDYDDAKANLKQTEAAVISSKASLELALLNLNYTHIKSPISGRIGKSFSTEGALVNANQVNTLSVVQQLDPIYVDITQPTSELLQLKKQNFSQGKGNSEETAVKLKLVLEDGTLYENSGTLKFTDVTVDKATGSVGLRAIFPNPNLDLLPGAFVRVILDQGEHNEAILIPQQSVSRNSSGQSYVFVVNSKNIVELRYVTVTKAIDAKWLINTGLTKGDKVITSGFQKIKAGSLVNPIEDLDQSSKKETIKKMKAQ